MSFADLLFNAFELLGTAAFAISGSMAAINKRADLFGVIFIGITSALGGGVLRDILLQNLPPKMFSNYIYVLVAALISAAVFLIAFKLKEQYRKNQKMIENINNLFDAAGLGIFTVTGARVAIEAGFGTNGFLVIFLGTVTGIGGGIIRDILIKEVPVVFRKQIYAVAAILGGCTYYLFYILSVHETVATAASLIITFSIRLLATIFKWNLPKAF